MQTTKILMEQGLKLAISIISYLTPLEDQEIFVQNFKDNKLVTREFENFFGYLVLKGGRFVALASGLAQISSHISSHISRDKILLKVVDDTVDNILDKKNVDVDKKNIDIDKSVEKC